MAQLEFEKKIWSIPGSDSTCESWKVYFDQQAKDFGPKNARKNWLLTWENEDGPALCTTNAAFNSWAKKNGVDVSNVATRTMASGTQIFENMAGLGASLSTMIKYGIPAILIAYLLFAGVKLAKGNGSIVPGFIKATPLGKVASIIT